MKTKEMTQMNLESVLLQFRTEAGTPRRGILEIYCRRYPEFARELTDYAVDWLLDEAIAVADASAAPSNASSPVVSRALSHLYNGIREREAQRKVAAQRPNVPVRNPFQGLPYPRKRELCTQVGIDMTIFAKLDKRLISDPLSIPRKFLDRLAGALQETGDAIIAHLQLPAMASAADDFKAEGKPSAGPKQRFKDAVRASSLDEKQKRALLED